jgi:motility quorum-sensing regulator/GCU-specific mRNA interferase toxin
VEKRRPSYDLSAIKRAIGTSQSLSITVAAFRDAVALGFDREGVAETIMTIEKAMFRKSMTTFADHRVWQDVYHVPVGNLRLYVKFQNATVSEFKVMSFKEL